MKVALIEASHWHVPLYLDPLETTGIGPCRMPGKPGDRQSQRGLEVRCIVQRGRSTGRIRSRSSSGRHSEMPSLAEGLIGRKLRSRTLRGQHGAGHSATEIGGGSERLLRDTVHLSHE
jgi:hypothetical protein